MSPTGVGLGVCRLVSGCRSDYLLAPQFARIRMGRVVVLPHVLSGILVFPGARRVTQVLLYTADPIIRIARRVRATVLSLEVADVGLIHFVTDIALTRALRKR